MLVSWVVVLLLACAVPFVAGPALLVVGLSVMAAAVGAIGLTLLFGTAGQLSLAHALFIAIGTYGYAFLSGSPGGSAVAYGGWGWPPVVGALAAILLAGVTGLAFSPISSRISGLYLGVASLALVVVGQHLMVNWTSVTGGSNGRRVPDFAIAGLTFTTPRTGERQLVVLGLPLGRTELLWYLFVAVLAAAWVVAARLSAGRTGRALRIVRDNETAAAVLGVHVKRYKALAFVISSLFAGAAGVLLALVLGNPVPDNFGLALSISYLAMVVIGGLGSLGGAVAGAVFVVAMPYLLTAYADVLPLVAAPGAEGLSAAVIAQFCYGGAVVAVLLLEPGGLTAVGRRLLQQLRCAPRRNTPVRAEHSGEAAGDDVSPTSRSTHDERNQR